MTPAARVNAIAAVFGLLATSWISAGCGPQAPAPAGRPGGAAHGPRANGDLAARPAEARRPLPEKALTPLAKLAPPVKVPVNAAKIDPIPPRAKKLVIDAYKLVRRRDFAGAIDLLERAKGYAPRNPRIRRALGIAYAGLPDPGRAAESLRQAAKQMPDDLEVQLLLGGLAYRNKQSDQAIVALRTALKCSAAKPSQPLAGEALLRLAEVLEQEGYLTAAAECYARLDRWVRRHGGAYAKHKQLRELVRRPELLLTRRGALLHKLRRPEEAIKLLERSYQLNRTSLLTARALVRVLLETRRFDRTEKLLLNMAAEPAQSRQVPELVESMIRATGDKKLPAKIYRAAGRRADEALGVALAGLAERLGDREQAAEILRALLQVKPDSPQAARRLARLHAGQGKAEAGLRILAQVLAENPSAEAAVRAGIDEIAQAAPRRDVERRFAESADASDAPRKFALHYVAGRLAQLAGGTDFAAEQYQQALRAKKDFLPAYALLAEIRITQKRLDRVQEVIDAARKAHGQDYFLDYLRGRLELARGNVAESLTALRRAHRGSPRHVPTLLALAEAYRRNGQTADTVSVLRAAARLRPDDARIARKLFDLYLARRRYAQAGRVVGRLLRTRPDSTAARLMRARLLLETGKVPQARKALELLAKQAPNDPDVALLRLQADIGPEKTFPPRKEFDELSKRLGQAIRARPGNAEARRMLAELYTRAGRDADAARVWKQLYEASADKSAVAEPYSRSLLLAGRYAAAAEVLKARLADSPDDPGVRQTLIETLAQLKKFDEAETLLKKWIAGAKEYQKLRYRLRLQELYETAGSYAKLKKFLDDWMAADKPGTSRRALRARKVRVFALAGELDEAIAYTKKWLKASPGDTIAKDILVEALLDKEAFDKAAPLLDEWLGQAEGEELRRMRRLKIVAHWKAGQIDKAEQAALAWIRQSPDDLTPRRVLLMVLIDRENYDRAAALLAGWIEAASRPAATAPASRAGPAPASRPAAGRQAASGPSQPQRPAQAARKRLSPQGLAWCREMHVAVTVMQQKYEKALKLIDAYLRIDPNNTDLLDQKSACMTELGRHAEALAALENSHRLSTRRLELAKATGSVQLIEAAEAAAASAANNLGYVYADRGVELQRAEDLAKAAVRQSPVPAFIDTLGWVCYKRGELSKAGAIFLELLRETEGTPGMHPVMLDHAGDVYYRLGWKRRAAEHWRRALAEAGKEKRRTAEIRTILQVAPKKIRALEKGETPPVAPLGKGVKDPLLK